MPNANTTNIQIRRSYANTTPTHLENSEIAYSFVSDKFFIGNNTNGIITIGGKYYTNIVDSANSENIPNTLVKRDANGAVKLGEITTTYYPTSNVNVVNKGYVDNVLAASHGSIYFEIPGNSGYSNVVTTSEGVNITANNKQIVRVRNDMIYLDEDVSVLNNIYLHDVISTGNLQSQNIIAYEKFFAGISTQLATQLPNTIAQFTGNTDSYVQVNAQNINPLGSGDYVVTADVGTDTSFYIDTGIQSSQLLQGALKPLDGYLLVQGNTGQPGGNLVIGTISATPALQTKFVAGGYDDVNIVMVMDSTGLNVHGSIYSQSLSGPTIDNIYNQTNNLSQYIDAANTYNQNYTNAANTWLQANDRTTLTTSKSYTDTANTWLQANTGAALAAGKVYTDTANTSLKLYAEANTGAALAAAKVYTDTATVAKSYTDTANTWLQANTGAALAAGKVYTDTANTFLQANDKTTLTTAKSYTDSANTWLQANDYLTWTISQTYTNTANTFLQANTKAYTDSANTWLQANTGAALAAAKVYTDTANTNNILYTNGIVAANLANARSYTDTANTYLNNKKVDRSGDTINGTLVINNAGASAALQVTGNVTISKDLTVTGNLAVLGNSTVITTASLELTDSLIMLATGNYTSDAVDIGIIGHYNAGTNAHSGIIRDPLIKEWFLFDGYTPEVSANNLINISDPSFNKSNINSNYFKGNLIGTTATVKGIELYNYSTASYAQANTTTLVASYAASKANGAVQTGFVNITANGTTSTATTNTDTLIFISAVANGINILNPSTKTIDFGLRNSGVTSGTYSYPSMTVDSFGRTTAISSQTPVITFNTRNGAVTLNYTDVITALGYYPLSNTGNTISGSYTGANNIGTTTVTLGNIAVTSNSYTTSGTSQIVLDSWPIDTYRSAKYQIQITSGSQYHVLEIRSLHDGTNSWINQFGEIITNQPLGSFTTSISGGNYNLLFTPYYSPTTIKLMRDIINI